MSELAEPQLEHLYREFTISSGGLEEISQRSYRDASIFVITSPDDSFVDACFSYARARQEIARMNGADCKVKVLVFSEMKTLPDGPQIYSSLADKLREYERKPI